MPPLPEATHLPADLRKAAAADALGAVWLRHEECAAVVALVERLQRERDDYAAALLKLVAEQAEASGTPVTVQAGSVDLTYKPTAAPPSKDEARYFIAPDHGGTLTVWHKVDPDRPRAVLGRWAIADDADWHVLTGHLPQRDARYADADGDGRDR
jgi:hypothetical protein